MKIEVKCKECGKVRCLNERDATKNSGLCKSCSHKGNRNGRNTHGMYGTRIYRIWANMKARCNNKNDYHYKNYGARGIKICDEWLQDFRNFYNWAINNGYRDDLTIDRINVNGNYEPSNCKWSTMLEQSKNRRASHLVTYNGETKNLKDWIRILKLNNSIVYKKLKEGKSIEEIFIGK